MTQPKRFAPAAIGVLCMVGFSICATPPSAEQAITTTLMPADDTVETFEVGTSGTTLQFQMNPLPADADLAGTGAGLRIWIVRSDDKSTAGSLNYLVDLTMPGKSRPIGEIRLPQNQPGKDEAATGFGSDLPDWLPKSGDGNLALALSTTTVLKSRRSWYGGSGSAASAVRRPRIALTYIDPERIAPTVATGQGASESPRTLDTHPAATGSGWLTSITLATDVNSQMPAFNEEMVYLVRGGELVALRAPASRPVWSVHVGTQTDYIVPTALDRLHIIGGGQIRSFELAEDRSAPPTEILKTDAGPLEPGRTLTVADLKPTAQPVAGPDGSLYITSNEALVGINPALRAIWRIPLVGEKGSRPTVGPKGDFVYVTVAPDDSQAPGKLLAIDAVTGVTRSAALPDGLLADRLAPPVVIDDGTNGDWVLVSASSTNGGILGLFTHRQVEKGTFGPKLVWELDMTGAPIQGIWGVPLPDPDAKTQVLASRVVQKGTAEIRVVTWSATGGLELAGSPLGKLGYTPVQDTPFWKSAGRLVRDDGGTLYAWDGDRTVLTIRGPEAEEELTGANAASANAVTLPPNADLGHHAPQNRLQFGGAGTFYALDAGERVLRALIPTLDTAAATRPCPKGTPPAANNNSAPKTCLESPTHLRLRGDMPGELLISVGGGVQLAPGTMLRANTAVALVPGPVRTGPAD